MSAVLALAWGWLAFLPARAAADRRTLHGRARALRAVPRRHARRRARRRTRRGADRRRVVATVAAVLRSPGRARRRRRASDAYAAEVADAVDLVGVGVAAGCTPFLAVELASRWAPRAVARECDTVVKACALGHAFDDALRATGLRDPALRGLCDALRITARTGAPAGPALARLATEVRAELRRRAEARARTVPVRLCFPLVGCILPAFALLTVVPVVLDGLHH